MADFVTAVKYQLPIKVIIIKNNSLGQIKWEQIVFKVTLKQATHFAEGLIRDEPERGLLLKTVLADK